MSVSDFLGPEFRSARGLPVVKIPGCAPPGDNYIETVAALLLHLDNSAPVPAFDELGRPAWLYDTSVQATDRPSVPGVFGPGEADAEGLVGLGCHGPVVQCNIAERGMIDGHGGCLELGGMCIGCTMPGFPDAFSPLHDPTANRAPATIRPPAPGGFLRRIRGLRGAKNVIEVDARVDLRVGPD